MSLDVRELPIDATDEASMDVSAPSLDHGLTDEELTDLALAADPNAEVGPLDQLAPFVLTDGLLPLAYMPPAAAGVHLRSRTKTVVAFVLIAAFLTITALGFCVTYGQLGPA